MAADLWSRLGAASGVPKRQRRGVVVQGRLMLKSPERSEGLIDHKSKKSGKIGIERAPNAGAERRSEWVDFGF